MTRQGRNSADVLGVRGRSPQENAGPPQRLPTGNHTLNSAAYSLGQLVAADALDQQRTVDALSAAAEAAGLEHAEVATTIASGLAAGARRPRVLPASTIRDPMVEPAGVVGGELDDSHTGVRAKAAVAHVEATRAVTGHQLGGDMSETAAQTARPADWAEPEASL